MAKDDEDILGPGAGHNSDTGTDNLAGRDLLHSIIERIERLEEEKKAIADDIKEVYAEAKANGFDTKALRRVVAYRKKDQAQVQEEEAIFELYLHSLGMLSDD